jgi:hypothetical protein
LKPGCEQLGHKGPRIAYVDNPAQSGFLFEIIPSLRETQDRYHRLAGEVAVTSTDNQASTTDNQAEQTSLVDVNEAKDADHSVGNLEYANSLPDFEVWFEHQCTYLDTSEAIETNAAAIFDFLNLDYDDTAEVVLGYDAEWNVPTDAWGNVIGRGKKTSLIQIAYGDGDTIKVVLYQVCRISNLPSSLVALLEHPKIRLTGCQVGGDIAKTNRDFGLNMNRALKAINLVGMAMARGSCLSGMGLDSLVAVALLGKQVDKTLQTSDWTKRPLPQP